jgi:hypothetical protein
VEDGERRHERRLRLPLRDQDEELNAPGGEYLADDQPLKALHLRRLAVVRLRQEFVEADEVPTVRRHACRRGGRGTASSRSRQGRQERQEGP